MSKTQLPAMHRLLTRVASFDGCWIFTGSTDGNGYGQFMCAGRMTKAHKASLWLHKGEWPWGGKTVMHSCDNRLCVNPEHLRIGTRAENMADMTRKNRNAFGTRVKHAKINDEIAREIFMSAEPKRKIAARLGISSGSVQRIREGVNWRRATAGLVRVP